MAIAACAMAAERDGPEVVKLMLWYPGTAGGSPTESMKNLSEGYFLDSGLMKWSMGHYLNGPEDMANPWVAPLKKNGGFLGFAAHIPDDGGVRPAP